MALSIDPAPHRKKCKRINTPNHSHFLTFSCFRRQPFLNRDRTCAWLADAIMTAQIRHTFDLIAYVFMPEHVHLLIRPIDDEYSISTILKSIKQPVAQKARNFVIKEAPEFIPRMSADGTSIAFWQAGGGYDRNIFSTEELWEKINYIHSNPVDRKLVVRKEDWLWSSAADYAHIQTGPLAVNIAIG